MEDINNREYARFLTEIKSRIILARGASRSDDKALVKLYWGISRSILERRKKYKWGEEVLDKLTGDLKEDFKFLFGFSTHSLWSMCQFYLKYKDVPI